MDYKCQPEGSLGFKSALLIHYREPMSWHEYYIQIATITAKKSKDPSSQVGCVIVDSNNRIVSTGFNGFVAGCDEDQMTYDRPMKYNLIIHAEMNALMFANQSVKGCTVYVTHHPCDNCFKHLLQAGIQQVYYRSKSVLERFSKDQLEAINKLQKSTGVSIEQI